MITQRYGVLELAYTTSFRLLWNDKGSGADEDGAFWLPNAQGDFRPIGPIVVNTYDDINGLYGGLLVKGDPGVVAEPVDYKPIWNDKGSGADRDGAVWRPIPPPGYVALGDLFWAGYDKPATNAIWCVRAEQTIGGDVGARQWWDKGSGAKADVSIWAVDTPRYPDNQEQVLYVPAFTFTAVPNYSEPSTTPVVNVLNLPSQVTVNPGPPIPVMTSYDRPPEEVHVIDRQDIVPFVLVKDDEKTVQWRVNNSPFYTLQRERWYNQIMYRDNRNGSEPARMSDSVETGVSQEESQAFSMKTGISVSATSGIDLFVKAEYTVSVSLELGYEHRYTNTVFVNETKTQEMTVPAHASGTLWAMDDQLFPIRRDGSILGSEGQLTFTTAAYVTGEYPPNAGVQSTALPSVPSARTVTETPERVR